MNIEIKSVEPYSDFELSDLDATQVSALMMTFESFLMSIMERGFPRVDFRGMFEKM